MKKNIISMLAAVAVVAAVFTGCKKGEEDPGLSLSSRKARMAGTWNLTSSTTVQKSVYTNPGSPTQTQDVTGGYDGTKEILTTKVTPNPSGNPDDKDTTVFTQSYTFEKDGTYSSKRVETSTNWNTNKKETREITTTGTWDFNKGVGELKKGEVVYIKELTEKLSFTVEGSAPVVTENTSNLSAEMTWVLVRLAKDEIKAYTTFDNSSKAQNGTTSTTTSRTDYVFTIAE